MAIQPTKRLFTIDDYYRMAESGIIARGDRVELIEGEIINMSPIGGRHVACVNRLTRCLVPAVGERAIVSVQNPIRLSDRSEPQPDVALLTPREDDSVYEVPAASEALLVIEVADSSLDYDLQTKAPLYARNDIPEFWIAALDRDYVSIRRDPTSDGYATTRIARRGEAMSPLAFPDLQFPVDDILG